MFNTLGNIMKIYIVAIYIRLSKEDDHLGESESIKNQKSLLTNYVKDNGYTLFDIYIDDGYTGTNFERPGFKRMLKDLEDGKVNMVITKDLSRLSRDYIGTGEYVEKWFPAHNIRYVALTDNIDTAFDNANNDIAPFKAVLNDMYAKDLSKKIRTNLKVMQKQGKWVGGCTPFGYMVNPKNKNHIIPNEIEAPIIKRIFNLFINGNKIQQIANLLNDDNVPTFSVTRSRNFERKGNGGNIYGLWCKTSIKKILMNGLYTGDMIQNKRSRVNYKYRKIVTNPKNQWIIVEDTHEALIDKETFNNVQKLLPKQKQRDDKKHEELLDGLLRCYECGHNISIKARRKNGKATTVCNYYRKYPAKNNLCSSHGIDYDTLEDGIINNLRKIIRLLNETKISKTVSQKHSSVDTVEEIQKTVNNFKKTIEITKENLDKMYIDKLNNKVTEEMFERVNEKLLKEIETKESLLKERSDYLNNLKNESNDLNLLNKTIKEFLKFKKPNRNLILQLIKYISISEDGNIDIHFNFKELQIINADCVTK